MKEGMTSKLKKCPTSRSREFMRHYACDITTRAGTYYKTTCGRCGADLNKEDVMAQGLCPADFYVCPHCYPQYCVVKENENKNPTLGVFKIVR